MTGKKDLSKEDLLRLGIYEDTGQADRNDEAILRITFPTLVGKATVKNEVLKHIRYRIEKLKESKRAVQKAALKGYTVEMKRLAAKIEVLAELYNEITNHYNQIDVEIRNRHYEHFDGDIDGKNIIVSEGKTLH
jgi:hypothetical protein